MIGGFHPIFVHFPIVLFTLTLICDILYYLGKDYGHKLALPFLWGGTLMCIPTLITGWEASETFPAGDPDVSKHMWMAFTLFGYAVAYSIFRFAALRNAWTFPPLLYLALSFALVTLTSWTSDRGGVVTHGSTPFSSSSTTSSQKH